MPGAPKKGRVIKAVNYKAIEKATVEKQGTRGISIRVLIGPSDGAENFVMRRFSVRKEGYTPRHSHDWEHEVYVLSGKGVVKARRKKYPISRGSVVFIPANREHQFVNTGKSNLEFLCLIPRK